jgi:hypothetical protein
LPIRCSLAICRVDLFHLSVTIVTSRPGSKRRTLDCHINPKIAHDIPEESEPVEPGAGGRRKVRSRKSVAGPQTYVQEASVYRYILHFSAAQAYREMHPDAKQSACYSQGCPWLHEPNIAQQIRLIAMPIGTCSEGKRILEETAAPAFSNLAELFDEKASSYCRRSCRTRWDHGQEGQPPQDSRLMPTARRSSATDRSRTARQGSARSSSGSALRRVQATDRGDRKGRRTPDAVDSSTPFTPAGRR